MTADKKKAETQAPEDTDENEGEQWVTVAELEVHPIRESGVGFVDASAED